MVAKMLLLAASASVALASASARTLKQIGPNYAVAYANANQKSRAYLDENYAEGVAEADTDGPENEAFADAQGSARYVSNGGGLPGGGNFATARTEAVTSSSNANEFRPNSQANAVSDANSDGAAEAVAVSDASATAGSAFARSNAGAFAVDFARTKTVAEAYGTSFAIANADTISQSAGGNIADTQVEAISVGGDADSFGAARTFTTDSEAEGFIGTPYARSNAVGYSKAEQGGAASSGTFAIAINVEEAQSTASAKSVAQSYTPPGGESTGAGPASSRAKSWAAGVLTLP